jgi:hypothetical protein
MDGPAAKHGIGCIPSLFFSAAFLCLYAISGIDNTPVEIALGLVCLLFAVVGRALQKLRAGEIMVRRSREAEVQVRQLAEGRPVDPFFLYLRPFYADDVSIDNPRGTSVPLLPIKYRPSTVAWETALAREIEQTVPLVALGRQSDTPSADRISTSDDEWRERFTLLAIFAEGIFLYPSESRGSLWELAWLRAAGQLDKCIFIVPPHFDAAGAVRSESWVTLRRTLGAVGLEVPSDVSGGAIFVLSNAGRLQSCQPFDLSKHSTRRTLQAVTRQFIDREQPHFNDSWRTFLDAKESLRSRSASKQPVAPERSADNVVRRDYDWIELPLE